MGGPESHDATAGQGLLQHVRHLLLGDFLHRDHRHLRQLIGNHRPRLDVQGTRLVHHRRLLHDAAVHHLQRSASCVATRGTQLSRDSAERQLNHGRHSNAERSRNVFSRD